MASDSGGGLLTGDGYCLYLRSEEDSRAVKSLDDYRFYCFNGEPALIYMYQSQQSREVGKKPSITSCDIFDVNWNHQPFHQKSSNSKTIPTAPINLEKMVELSRTLSAGTSFLRCDIYEIQGKVYAGELTLFPGSGVAPFYPPEWDLILGSKLKLPIE